MLMRWNDIPQISESRKICRSANLEDALNNETLLTSILSDTLEEVGLSSSSNISCDILFHKMGEMVLLYSKNDKIAPKKILALIAQYHEEKACLILGHTAVCLMEDYGLIKGGPKIP